jgi:putative ABC transport system ATP-binding protein
VADNINILRLEGVNTGGMDALLDRLGILRLKKRRVKGLSGGEKQRVAIARALIKKPRIILADEPTGNLDRDTQKEIMDIFRDLTNQGKCVILVSHSPDVADMCDERYELTKISGKKERT